MKPEQLEIERLRRKDEKIVAAVKANNTFGLIAAELVANKEASNAMLHARNRSAASYVDRCAGLDRVRPRS